MRRLNDYPKGVEPSGSKWKRLSQDIVSSHVKA
nr:MAG TPA: hypothetical protein [Bacteriophage sp.]